MSNYVELNLRTYRVMCVETGRTLMDTDDYAAALSARYSWEVDDRFHEYILIAVIETDPAPTGTTKKTT